MFRRIFDCFLSLSILFLMPSLSTARSVVMMFGDSITQGTPYNLVNGNGGNFGPSVIELEYLLNNSYRPALVLNWGIGGTNSFQGVQRIASNISTTLETYPNPDDQYFILLHYGTNDRNYGLLPSDTEFNTSQMIDAAHAQSVTPIVGALLPNSGDSVEPYNNAIQAAVNSRSVAYVNHYHDFLPVDGNLFVYQNGAYVHPNLVGYSLLASNWFNYCLSSLIKAEPPVITPMIHLLLDYD